jgi:hypothetical protein
LHFRSIHLEADAALLVGSLNKGRLEENVPQSGDGFPKMELCLTPDLQVHCSSRIKAAPRSGTPRQSEAWPVGIQYEIV